jgi:hypothetical protein
MCVQAVDTLSRLWEISSSEDRQGLARNLFEYLVYDLDTQRFTDFRLKSWADRYVVLRADLYQEELGENENVPPSIENGTPMPSRGIKARLLPYSSGLVAQYSHPYAAYRTS